MASSSVILYETLNEVFEENQSLCLDNENERQFLKGLVIGTFMRLTAEDQEKNNESNS